MIIIILLTGCWNRVEVNDIAIVTAIGIDLTEDDKLLLSIQVAIPVKLGPTSGSQGGSSNSTFVVSETGDTISEAYRNIQGKISRNIFFSQSRVLLIGEDMAKKGISNIIDFHSRYNEPRINSFIMFTKGQASELINNMPQLESISAEETKELAKIGAGLSVYIRDFMNMLLTDGKEPVAPQFSLTPLEENTKNKSREGQEINGAAVFKGDKLVGWLDKTETRGLLWIRNEIETGVITINIPEDQGGGNISFEIIRVDSKIKPKLQNGEINLSVDVTSELSIMENDSKLNVDQTQVLDELEKYVENEIKDRIQLVVDIAQKEYQSDIFGFGQAVYKKYPKEWNVALKNNWDQTFEQLEVNITPKVFIRRIGLSK
ncbi:Ger(x)C family spore germination protein [Fredinandcohnia sp. SECRCQ15]|uniref:Ger(X)C family spore germination protein n=1 Tax=Fredinandcohnia quinoae TaxID=2918902 RepID=A0AAW5E2X1_9BACI|nr:Ger(x)C family spore germination protein [Fredinandcohnia sp. SECRCQ15]